MDCCGNDKFNLRAFAGCAFDFATTADLGEAFAHIDQPITAPAARCAVRRFERESDTVVADDELHVSGGRRMLDFNARVWPTSQSIKRVLQEVDENLF